MKPILFLFCIGLSSCNFNRESCVVGKYMTTELEHKETLEIFSDYTYIHTFQDKKHSGTWRMSRTSKTHIFLEKWLSYQSPYKDEIGMVSNVSLSTNCKVIKYTDVHRYHFHKVK